MRKIAATLLFAMAFVSVSEAQELTAALSAYGSFGLDDLDGNLPVSAELRFSLPLTDRFALEPFITTGSQPGRGTVGPEGFYGAQIRQRFVRLTTRNAYAFATYGVAAYYSRYGSYPPVIGFFGLGLNHRMSKHVSFRPEIQLVSLHVVPIGARFVAGVSLN